MRYRHESSSLIYETLERAVVEQDSSVADLSAATKDYLDSKEREKTDIDSKLGDPDTSDEEKRELRKRKTDIQKDIRDKQAQQRELKKRLQQSARDAAQAAESAATRSFIESVW